MSQDSTSGWIQVVGNESPKLEWPEPPPVTMLPRDQLAQRLELQRAIEKVKAAGYDLVPRQTLGCEGSV